MRRFPARVCVIWLAISAFLAIGEVSAQSTRKRVSTAPPGRPRLARAMQPQSPSGPDIPAGPDAPFDDLTPPSDGGFETPLDTDPTPLDIPPPATPGNGAATPRPAPATTLKQPEPEEELYEPFAQDYAGEYEATSPVPPNGYSKGAISQYSGPRDWFVEIDFAMYRRNRPGRVNFAFNTVASGGQLFFVPIFGTENFDYAFEASGRATIGRGLLVDAKQRDHSLELTYIGTNDWNVNWIIDRGGGTPLVSGFDVNGPATPFDLADRYTLDSSSDLQSFELNYMIRCRLERDRLVYSPSGVWRREAYPGWRPALGFGIRYLSFDDSFVYKSTTNTGNVVASGEYRVDDRNSMVGAQVKGEFMYQTWRYSLGVRGGAAGCANFQEVNGFLSGQTTATTVADIAPISQSLREQDAGVIGDLGVVMNYRLTDRLTVHAGYDFMWLGGVSLAPEQITYNTNLPVHLDNSGFVLMQGGSLGIEYSW